MDEYKQYHEAFMQNQNGTSAVDAFITILPNFFTCCVAKLIIAHFGIKSILLKILLEFTFIVVPLILGTTILADFRRYVLLFSMTLFLFVGSLRPFHLKNILEMRVDRRRKWECISYIRSLIYLVTAHCILAVDFRVFPRYFAKTETYGYSFMDLGVGLFVFSNALVPSKVSRHSLMKSLEMNIKPCFILLVLGTLRVILVKKTDYHEHITEYGVHWNFFFTLAITKMFATTILCIFNERNALLFGSVFLFIHEIFLGKGLSGWVFGDETRNNFISANREGISSCLGYISLYLISTFVGLLIREKEMEKTERSVIVNLFLFTTLSWLGVFISGSYLSVSRCLANAGYCFFVLAIGTSILFLFFLIELNDISTYNSTRKHARGDLACKNMPVVFSSINNNALLFFLMSNMLTGLINIFVRTLYQDEITSLCILLFYMIGLIIFVVILDFKFKKLAHTSKK